MLQNTSQNVNLPTAAPVKAEDAGQRDNMKSQFGNIDKENQPPVKNEDKDFKVKREGNRRDSGFDKSQRYGKRARVRGRHRLTKNGIDMKTFFKTKICPFLLAGHCSKGSECSYAHSQVELRDQPNLKKTKLCQLYLLNKCNMGLRCSYAHGQHELRSMDAYKSTPCASFAKGECTLGEECRFAHDRLQIHDINLHSNGCSMVGNSVIGYSMQLSNNTQPKQEASFEQFANSFQNNMMMNYGMGMMGGMGGMGQGMMMNPPAVVMPRNETEIAKIKEEAENAFCMESTINLQEQSVTLV